MTRLDDEVSSANAHSQFNEFVTSSGITAANQSREQRRDSLQYHSQFYSLLTVWRTRVFWMLTPGPGWHAPTDAGIPALISRFLLKSQSMRSWNSKCALYFTEAPTHWVANSPSAWRDASQKTLDLEYRWTLVSVSGSWIQPATAQLCKQTKYLCVRRVREAYFLIPLNWC